MLNTSPTGTGRTKVSRSKRHWHRICLQECGRTSTAKGGPGTVSTTGSAVLPPTAQLLARRTSTRANRCAPLLLRPDRWLCLTWILHGQLGDLPEGEVSTVPVDSKLPTQLLRARCLGYSISSLCASNGIPHLLQAICEYPRESLSYQAISGGQGERRGNSRRV